MGRGRQQKRTDHKLTAYKKREAQINAADQMQLFCIQQFSMHTHSLSNGIDPVAYET